MRAFTSAQKKLAVIVIAGVLFFGGLTIYALKPLLGKLDDLNSQATAEKNAYNQLLAEVASYRTAQVEFAKIKDKAEEISSLFPLREGLVKNVERLESAAAVNQNEYTLAITDVKKDTPEEKDEVLPEYTIVPGLFNVEVIPYDFHLTGTFLGVIKFLQTLEHQPFFSEIETLNINSILSNAESATEIDRSRSGAVEARIRAAFYSKLP